MLPGSGRAEEGVRRQALLAARADLPLPVSWTRATGLGLYEGGSRERGGPPCLTQVDRRTGAPVQMASQSCNPGRSKHGLQGPGSRRRWGTCRPWR